jgi:hypothetical protein
MLYRVVRWASGYEEYPDDDFPKTSRKFRGLNSGSVISTRGNAEIESRGFRLNVYRASGGIVVESTIYDEKKDRNLTGLYVIADDADIGKEISKIITVEGMKL